MLQKLEAIKKLAVTEIESAADAEGLEQLRIKYLGKKGEITQVMKEMGGLSAEQRPVIGQVANEVREVINDKLSCAMQIMEQVALAQRIAEEMVDVTLPARVRKPGKLHPLTLVVDDVRKIFMRMGFSVEEGPEIESDYYNFEALNFPPGHPARDMQDSFYINGGRLLRTHTSPVQVRTLERMQPEVPVRIIAPGRVYRKDDIDNSHSAMFYQVEGLAVDKGITFGNLKAVISYFVRELFGPERSVRFRPSFFPFTEPSAEVDISCNICGGAGCRTCSQTGWLEIMGAGMVHPNELRMAGYDPDIYSGFAFGMGAERIAMLRYGIDDIRLFYENDIRFLDQF